MLEMAPEPEPPARLTIVPDEFVNPAPIPSATRAAVERWIEDPSSLEFGAPGDPIAAILLRAPPRLHPGPEEKAPKGVPNEEGSAASGKSTDDLFQRVVDTAVGLQQSYLAVQGPPGTGKTTVGARIIASAVEQGLTVAVTANSHKVIHNMMRKAAENLGSRQIKSNFIVVSSNATQDVEDMYSAGQGFVQVMRISSASKFPAEDLEPSGENGARCGAVIGATAWGLSNKRLAEVADLLVVDEAGQVPVSRLPAMGRCLAKRSRGGVVLLGDQMQLANPSEGVHPGDGGDSCLEYLLQDQPVISRDYGFFLPVSFRLHPELCQVVSALAYQRQLTSHKSTLRRRLVLADTEIVKREAGVQIVPVPHLGNLQESDEEALTVAQIVRELCDNRAVQFDDSGERRQLTLNDIVIVTPFNQQRLKLEDELGPGARIGTVDLFQGQEAAVVIVSLARSGDASGILDEGGVDELEMLGSGAGGGGRGTQFVLDLRRLNVAISRAQCLAMVVMSPGLAQGVANSVPQMRTLSFACKLLEFSGADGGKQLP
uniref:DNA2/NAM7 helicase-like C-terminal domain-containing protein n=1 Tax=Rhizochromulina marina TaxID=1034831 RepID=A0A7S2ST75_9STRA